MSPEDKDTIEQIAHYVDNIRQMVAYIGLILLALTSTLIAGVISVSNDIQKIETNVSRIERALIPPTPIRVIEAEDTEEKQK